MPSVVLIAFPDVVVVLVFTIIDTQNSEYYSFHVYKFDLKRNFLCQASTNCLLSDSVLFQKSCTCAMGCTTFLFKKFWWALLPIGTTQQLISLISLVNVLDAIVVSCSESSLSISSTYTEPYLDITQLDRHPDNNPQQWNTTIFFCILHV